MRGESTQPQEGRDRGELQQSVQLVTIHRWLSDGSMAVLIHLTQDSLHGPVPGAGWGTGEDASEDL